MSEVRKVEILSRDGTRLHVVEHTPEQEARGAVAFIHGIGSHVDRHRYQSSRIVKGGYVFYGLDLRGHGRSAGQRGFVSSWNDFRDDVDALLSFVRSERSEIPVFLNGFSLGGAIALDYGIFAPDGLAGVAVSAPSIGKVDISPVLWRLAKIANRVLPRFSLKTGMDPGSVSRNEAYVKDMLADPISHSKGSARLGVEYSKAVEALYENAQRFSLPLLIQHGESDRLADPEGSLRFFDSCGSADKTRITYPGAYHELDNDFDAQDVLDDLVAWFDKHT